VADWAFDLGSAEWDGGDSAPFAVGTAASTDTTTNDNGPGVLWWERIHVHPREIEVGNIVTTTVVELDVFNAYRDDDKDWDDLDINANGVTVNNPSLPETLQELEGIELDVTISAEGAANVDGNLTFTFGSTTIVVPLIFQRLVAIAFVPETNVVEDLEWQTNVIEALSGKEKRQAVRRRPRQSFLYEIAVEDGTERQRLENLLFLHTGKLVGVPVWAEPTRLTGDVSIGATSLSVTSTNYADYRDDGTAVIWVDETDFEVVNVESFTTTTITLATSTANAFDAGAIVMPLRIAQLLSPAGSTRQHLGETRYRLQFIVTDNDTEIADDSAFSTYNSKVLLDDPNFGESVRESYTRKVHVLDGGSGLRAPYTTSDVARRTSHKQFITDSPQTLWETRQLLHALRGRQVSFYLPTFGQEITPTQTLVSGTATMDVANVGFTDTGMVSPRDEIRVVKTDGTTLERTVTDVSEIDADEERISVDENWPSNITVDEIDRVEILELVRLDSDKIRIQHKEVGGDATIDLPVKAVLT